jgi:nitrate/nitrite-specific signal transduction histidine kinase
VFSRDERRVFGADDAELLELFARHAAIALAHARMLEAAEERARSQAAAAERDRLLADLHDTLAQPLVWRGISVRRNYVGYYCTSLDMAGTSITLSRLDDEVADLLAAPAEIAIRTF